MNPEHHIRKINSLRKLVTKGKRINCGCIGLINKQGKISFQLQENCCDKRMKTYT